MPDVVVSIFSALSHFNSQNDPASSEFVPLFTDKSKDQKGAVICPWPYS